MVKLNTISKLYKQGWLVPHWASWSCLFFQSRRHQGQSKTGSGLAERGPVTSHSGVVVNIQFYLKTLTEIILFTMEKVL